MMKETSKLSIKQNIKLARSIEAIRVPSGIIEVLPSASLVEIAQLRQEAVTVLWRAQLYWIQADQIDALGLIAPARPFLTRGADRSQLMAFIWQQLKTCFDPEIPVNIVDLGLVYEVKIQNLINGKTLVLIQMTLTAPGCGIGEVIAAEAKRKILGAEQVDEVIIEWIWNPPWSREKMTEAARLSLGLF